MFVRMLKLPDAVRLKYDVSSMKSAIHAAAPCPIDVKRKMIEWWGPVLHEYYAGTEGNGLCYVSSADWLDASGHGRQARWWARCISAAKTARKSPPAKKA